MILEGAVKFDGSGVFYNPAMRFNRSISTLAVRAISPKKLLDGFSASGVRGLRYALEGNAKEVTFLDSDPKAVKKIKSNLKRNSLKAETIQSDFNSYCYANGGFDFVEVDPFGSPANYIAAAVAAIARKGVLSVTATDLANTCASAKSRAAVCRREYGAEPVKCDCSHELALRILIAKMAREAAAQGYGLKPLVSWHERHYNKSICLLERRVSKADAALEQSGFVSFDEESHGRVEGERKGWKRAGPLWLGDYCDSAFLKRLVALAEGDKEKKFLGLLEGELGFPSFHWDLHALSGHYSLEAKSTAAIVDALRVKGFKAVRAHYAGTTVKTDAGLKGLLKALK